jgi:hypothetical protein
MKQWKSSLPGFSAEAALVPSSKLYRQGASSRSTRPTVVLPQGKAVVVPQVPFPLCLKLGAPCDPF